MLEACGFSCPFPVNDTVTCLSQPHNKKETASGMQMGDYNYQRHFHLGFHRKQKLRTEDNLGLHFPCSMDSSVHDLSVDVLLELKKIREHHLHPPRFCPSAMDDSESFCFLVPTFQVLESQGKFVIFWSHC